MTYAPGWNPKGSAVPIDDLWYKSKRGPNNERLKSARYGRGKRWRVRYDDADGNPSTEAFERKADAEAFDLAARTGTRPAPKPAPEPAQQTLTFREYGERWRVSRTIGQALEYQRHTETRLRIHLYPTFGHRPIRKITLTEVLEWLANRRAENVANTSLRTYFDLLNMVMNAAKVDKELDDNPCQGIRISAILRGLSRAPKWVPNDGQVLALLDAVPDRFKAAIWLGAGEGMRIGEVLGSENSRRTVDEDQIHVVQQLQFHKREYGGFYLSPPKAGSVGDVDLDSEVATMLTEHVRKYPPVGVELPDITNGIPDPGKPATRRTVQLLFTDELGRPIHDQRWSDWFRAWRRAAGWSEDGTFHSLRHYFATTLITQGVDPTDVQRALRHSSLRITLETYVHWWPKAERRRSVIGGVLTNARGNRS
jgi:integrase